LQLSLGISPLTLLSFGLSLKPSKGEMEEGTLVLQKPSCCLHHKPPTSLSVKAGVTTTQTVRETACT